MTLHKNNQMIILDKRIDALHSVKALHGEIWLSVVQVDADTFKQVKAKENSEGGWPLYVYFDPDGCLHFSPKANQDYEVKVIGSIYIEQ